MSATTSPAESSTATGGPTTTTSTAAATVTNAIVKTVEAIISSTAPAASQSPSPSPSGFSTPTQSPTSSSTPTTTASMGGPEEKLSVQDLSQTLQHFGVVDYLVFIAMLAVCAVIGVYFGFIEKKQKAKKKGQLAGKDGAGAAGVEERRGSEALDYLVGGRQMKVFPVALSLVASFVSGISLLGTSTEIYVYGTQYAFILVTLAISGAISWYIFLPVFCNLQLTSTYEYFQLRYGAGIRNLGAVLFIVDTTIWLPLCMYIPAITYSQVTGTGIYVITPIVCIICTFYTCVGGLKAVIWTDVIQSFVMFGSILAVCIKGTYDVGGLPVVLQRNEDSGRLNVPEWTWDPTVRLSMLSVIVGGTLHKMQSSDVNQVSIQRFLSLPSYEHAKRCMLVFTLLLIFLLSCCCYMGLVSYAVYHDCDPISTKLAKASDQLPSLLMMRTLGSWPGLPGLFVAGVFSAALSSLSTGLNSLACVVTQDIMRPLLKKPLTERQTAFWLRAIVVGFGFSCIGMVNIVEKLGNVIPLVTTTSAVTMGPLLGIYCMGVGLPWVKGKSVMVGSLVSFLALGWICVKAQLGKMNGEIRYPKMPVSVEGCDYSFDNATVFQAIHDYSPSERNLYHLSFFWYTAFGGVICTVFSLLASLFFGWEDLSQMDPALITPCMRRFLPKKNCQAVNMQDLFKR
ncbi:sodium-coupled monocarboxylate transporter 1 isoform X7 [Drosophila miranda]|uniref:sodium-coupled monocarboxylate transporter 1 isoform X8 n=1 Tax=Drosophila miranda TaxID=7229 RepID=UPI0007E775F3|nr:sodium-coupled monocarboxylate transporter 1 isoform X8 [Drosophila miranda]XP_033245196.1 sodium-coupled monocarboxylate transporter 1 isoform X7 [Drosophila miranda]